MANVLHIIESLEFGGAEKVLLQLANGMSSYHNIRICVTKREGDLLKDVKDNITVFSLKAREGNDLTIIPKIAKIIRDENIDIVHIHNWGVFIESVLAAKYAGANKIIHTVHGPYLSYSEGFLSRLKISSRHFIERLISIFVFRFVCVSDSIQDYMIHQIGISKKRLVTIHNGIKGLVHKKRTDSLINTVNLVSIGRVARIKNHKLLIEALSKIGNTLDLHLTVVGDGPELDTVKEYTRKLGLSNKINFLGFRKDIDKIMQDMDICVVTSDYEGVSIAILEAMSVGIPVIASNVGGNPETVSHNETGLLFEKGNVDELVSVISKIITDKQLQKKMGAAGYQRFLKHFHEKNVLKQYAALYAE